MPPPRSRRGTRASESRVPTTRGVSRAPRRRTPLSRHRAYPGSRADSGTASEKRPRTPQALPPRSPRAPCEEAGARSPRFPRLGPARPERHRGTPRGEALPEYRGAVPGKRRPQATPSPPRSAAPRARRPTGHQARAVPAIPFPYRLPRELQRCSGTASGVEDRTDFSFRQVDPEEL